MDIEICGRLSVVGLLASDPGASDLLVISNPGAGLPDGVESLTRRILHFEFDDFADPRDGVVLVTADDVQQALAWSRESDRLIVCCHAGVSRSAAMAYVIACRDHPPTEALALLSEGWHHPNERIVRLGAELLGNPEVYTACLAWLGGPSSAGTAWRRRFGA